MKKLLILSFAMGVSINIYAQDQPQPPQGKHMPNYLPDETPAEMPNTEFLGGYGSDPLTGQPHYYMDTESGLYFDFQEKIVRNFKTGKEYTFEELEKLLRKERDVPQELKKKRI
jgi:hypothetical protein